MKEVVSKNADKIVSATRCIIKNLKKKGLDNEIKSLAAHLADSLPAAQSDDCAALTQLLSNIDLSQIKINSHFVPSTQLIIENLHKINFQVIITDLPIANRTTITSYTNHSAMWACENDTPVRWIPKVRT